MTDLREQFEAVLAELGELMRVPLALDGSDSCALRIGSEIDVRLTYVREGERLAVRSPAGELPPDAAASGLARRLLALCGDADASRGLVLAMDGGTRRLEVRGECPATWLHSADRLAEWLERLILFRSRIRDEIEGGSERELVIIRI